MVTVSVIIPTYNRLWSLKDAVESCRASNYGVEVIVVDDGSTDGTWEWLSEQEDIISIKQENWGKCWAVNKGFAAATGKYVRFLDSDDLLAENSNDELIAIAEPAGCDICVSGYKTVTEAGKTIKEQKWISCDDFIAQQLGECDSSHYSAYLFKRSFIEDIPHRPDFAFRDDRLFVLEAALKEPIVGIHNGFGLVHRIHGNNRLQNQTGIQQQVQNYQHFAVYRKIVKILAESGRLDVRRSKAVAKILWPLAHWTAKYDIREAAAILNFIYGILPGFAIPDKGLHGYLFTLLGFTGAQRVMNMYRFFRYGPGR